MIVKVVGGGGGIANLQFMDWIGLGDIHREWDFRRRGRSGLPLQEPEIFKRSFPPPVCHFPPPTQFFHSANGIHLNLGN